MLETLWHPAFMKRYDLHVHTKLVTAVDKMWESLFEFQSLVLVFLYKWLQPKLEWISNTSNYYLISGIYMTDSKAGDWVTPSLLRSLLAYSVSS